jgi:hypothetical protein
MEIVNWAKFIFLELFSERNTFVNNHILPQCIVSFNFLNFIHHLGVCIKPVF